MIKNTINFCTSTGNNCTGCGKRIYDKEKDIIKVYYYDEIKNTVFKDKDGNIEVFEMFHLDCSIDNKRKLN